MDKAILFVPSDEAIDRSLDARSYVTRLRRRIQVETRRYDERGLVALDDVSAGGSVAVLAGLSSLELDSGYVEMELDTIFQPQELLGKLRAALSQDFPIIAIVDDAYSDYVMVAFVKAGASAVVGTSGDLFGVVTSRLRRWDDIFPYINVYPRV